MLCVARLAWAMLECYRFEARLGQTLSQCCQCLCLASMLLVGRCSVDVASRNANGNAIHNCAMVGYAHFYSHTLTPSCTCWRLRGRVPVQCECEPCPIMLPMRMPRYALLSSCSCPCYDISCPAYAVHFICLVRIFYAGLHSLQLGITEEHTWACAKSSSKC